MTTIDLKGERPIISTTKTNFKYDNYVETEFGTKDKLVLDMSDAKEYHEQLDKVLYPGETREDLLREIEELKQQLEDNQVKGAA